MKNNYIKSLLVLTVAFFVSFGYSQSNLTNSEYGSGIQQYLDQNKDSYNLVSSDLADLYVNKEFFSTKSKITHVYVNQRYQGINIFNAISSVSEKISLIPATQYWSILEVSGSSSSRTINCFVV